MLWLGSSKSVGVGPGILEFEEGKRKVTKELADCKSEM